MPESCMKKFFTLFLKAVEAEQMELKIPTLMFPANHVQQKKYYTWKCMQLFSRSL